MFRSMTILLVLLVATIPSSIVAQAPIPIKESRIINGFDVAPGRFPYSVSLQISNFHFCGGSLIAPNVVLSAAHCEPADINTVEVHVNPHDLDAPGSNHFQRSVVQMVIHPQYTSNFENDVMLLLLDSPVPGVIQPVTLNTDTSKPAVGELLTVVGWGTTVSGTNAVPEVLQGVNVNHISQADCIDAYSASEVTSDMLCCVEANQGSCQGDSGGPLVIPGSATTDIQVGIVSWGILCAVDRYPGVYNRLSNSVQWIKSSVCDMTNNNAPTDFQCTTPTPPTPPPIATPAPTPPTGPQQNVLLQLQLDNFPSEVGWSIRDENAVTVAEVVSPSYQVAGQVVLVPLTLEKDASYILRVSDQSSDGICCDFGSGSIKLYLGDSADESNLLAENDGRFLHFVELPFTAGSSGIGGGPTMGKALFTVRFQTDDFPSESEWHIQSEDAAVLWYEKMEDYNPGEEVVYVVELELGLSYRFVLFDEQLDGICCDYGEGDAAVYYGNKVDESKLLVHVDGVFTDDISEWFVAEDPSNAGADGPTNDDEKSDEYTDFLVRFVTDGWPSESSWDILTLDGEKVWHAKMAEWNGGDDVLYNIELKLGDSYYFNVYDTHGDGLCCAFGSGFAKIYYGTASNDAMEVAFIDGNFDFSDFVLFEAKSPQQPQVAAFCFPGTAEVEGRDGSVLMKDLKLGDKVLTQDGKCEAVYSFGHYKHEEKGQYLQITTTSTKLEMTGNHMVFMEGGRSVPASSVEIGDRLELASGAYEPVQRIKVVTREGAYAPFTTSGTIIVNGVKASSFVAFQNSETLLIGATDTGVTYQFLAHTFELPHRLWCSYFASSSCTTETYTDNGVSTWVDLPHKLTLWFLKQHSAVMTMLFVPLLAVFVMMKNPATVLLCVLVAIMASVASRFVLRVRRGAHRAGLIIKH